MYIQTEETPNPEALKFLPDHEVSPEGPIFYNNPSEAAGSSELAQKLFQVTGVEAVFFGSNFITVTKTSQTDWSIIKPEILMTIMDHLVAGLPILSDANSEAGKKVDTINTENLSDIEKQIVEIIDTRVRPSVAMDGGDIVYKGFKEGIVYLELRGACSGCPSSSITLKSGIESMLQHFIPEVKAVEASQ